MDLKKAPRWVIFLAVAAMITFGAIGVWQTSSPPPLPGPTPVPSPNGKPTPPPVVPVTQISINDVWRPLVPPSKNVVEGLELPTPFEISSDRRYVIITAKCDGPVRWLLSAKSGSAMVAVESPLTNSVQIMPGAADDVITVLAYTVTKKNVPSDMAVTVVTVKDDKPVPAPTPSPKPEPTPAPSPSTKPDKVTAMHVTFYLDFAKQTRAISDIVNDSGLRDWLKTHGHEVHELSVKTDPGVFGLEEALKGKYPPLVILQAKGDPNVKDGTLIDVQPLDSVQQVKDLVTRHTK